jgi:hypothetical protein
MSTTTGTYYFSEALALLVGKGSQRAFTSIGIRPGLCGIEVPRRCRRAYSFGWLVPTLPAEAKEALLMWLGARYKPCFSTNQTGAAERILYIYNRLPNCQSFRLSRSPYFQRWAQVCLQFLKLSSVSGFCYPLRL